MPPLMVHNGDEGGAPWTPAFPTPSGNALPSRWHAADSLQLANGDMCSAWPDLSANAAHAAAAESQRPTYIAAIPALRFDGQANIMGGPRLVAESTYSLFVVASGSPQINRAIIAQHRGYPDAGRAVFVGTSASATTKAQSFYSGAATYLLTSTATAFGTGQLAVLAAWCDGSTASLSVGSATADASVAVSWTAYDTYLSIGAYGYGGVKDQPFAGDICEILAYSAALDLADRSQAIAYLAEKWGLL